MWQDIATLNKDPDWAGGSLRLQKVMHALGCSKAGSCSIGGKSSNSPSKRKQGAGKRSAAAPAAAAPLTAAKGSGAAVRSPNANRTMDLAAQLYGREVGQEVQNVHLLQFLLTQELAYILEQPPNSSSQEEAIRALVGSLPGVPEDIGLESLMTAWDSIPKHYVDAWNDPESRVQILEIMACRLSSNAQKNMRLGKYMQHRK